MIIESLKPLETDINSIKIDPKNARKHPVNNLAAIKKSLETYGQRKPIVVNQNTNTIEAGNGLYIAAKEMGWKTIACVFVDDTKEMSTAYGLMDNQSALISEWDMPTLKDLLQELDTGELDMAITGFTSEELENMMTEVHQDFNFTTPSQQEIDKRDSEMGKSFQKKVSDEQNTHIKLSCPECGASFSVRIGDLTKKSSV